MAIKKSTQDQNKVSDEGHPIHDISYIRNKLLFSSIATKSSPDLCRSIFSVGPTSLL